MEFKFIAINGDNVGEGIGNAIATDNHEELSKITGGLKEAHAGIEEWAQAKGGEIVTSSGDEAIVKVPADMLDDSELESIKSQYSETSGHSVTIGIGDSMSEASKALIYGKMNDKDQIVHYDAHIDDYISDFDSEQEEDFDTEAESEEQMDESSEDMGEESNSELIEDDSKELEDENGAVPQIEEEFDEDTETPSEETEEDLDEDLMDEGAIAEEDDSISSEEQLQDFASEEGEGIPEHEQHLSPEDKAKHDSTELMSDKEEIAQEQAAAQAMGKEGTEQIGVPADQVDSNYSSEEMAAAQPEHEQAMGEEEEFVHDAQENREDELDGDNIEADQESPEDQQSALQDMIYSNMEGDQEPFQDPAELKQKVAQILISFKENKMLVEEMKTSNPRGYESIMGMLESMIEMAKQLNMDPEAEADSMEAQDALPDADMSADEDAPEDFSEEDSDIDEEEMEDDEEMEKAERNNVRVGAKKLPKKAIKRPKPTQTKKVVKDKKATQTKKVVKDKKEVVEKK